MPGRTGVHAARRSDHAPSDRRCPSTGRPTGPGSGGDSVRTPDRNRLGWWLYVAVLFGATAFIAYHFVGALVLGVFGYYAIRPICARVGEVIDNESVAAAVAIATVLVPVLLLLVYTGVRVFQGVQEQLNETVTSLLVEQFPWLRAVPAGGGRRIDALLRNPPSLEELWRLGLGPEVEQSLALLDAVFGALLIIGIGVTLSYALLEHDQSLSEGFATLVGGEDTTAYTYALAVDHDLESIFFGNLLFAAVMSVVAIATYGLTNLVAPAGISVPMVFTLGFLTGVTSLVPVVVGKVVHLPVVGYLAFQAVQAGRGFVFVGGTLVVYVLVLDLLPQSLVQPYVSGRKVDVLLLLFAYVLGPIMFGWYGFFLMPIVFVLVLEAARIVLPELVHGEPIHRDADMAEDAGTDLDEIDDEVATADRTDEGVSNPEGADGT